MLECAAGGIGLDSTVTEVGCGLSGDRAELSAPLSDSAAITLVVEHRDWLARFDVEHLEVALVAQSRRIVVLDASEVDDDLVAEVTEVRTSMWARLWGRRSAAKRANVAMRAAEVLPR